MGVVVFCFVLFCFAVAKEKENVFIEYHSYEPRLEIKQKQGEKKLLKDLVRTVLLEGKKLQNIRVLVFPWRRIT